MQSLHQKDGKPIIRCPSNHNVDNDFDRTELGGERNLRHYYQQQQSNDQVDSTNATSVRFVFYSEITCIMYLHKN